MYFFVIRTIVKFAFRAHRRKARRRRARGGSHVGRQLGLKALAGAVLAYRLIPEGTRERWSFGCSTSRHGLGLVRHPKATFWRAFGMLVLMSVPHLSVDAPGKWEWQACGVDKDVWRSGRGWGD